MICVGIDIAKGKSTVCFLKPGGEVLKAPYDIEHTAEEVGKLIRDTRGTGSHRTLPLARGSTVT